MKDLFGFLAHAINMYLSKSYFNLKVFLDAFSRSLKSEVKTKI